MTGWINHRQVEAFHVVMLTGSMTTAGALLGITQPAVSRLIREFEGKLGFALFQRHGTNIKPTPEAVQLHREVVSNMQALSRIETTAKGIASAKTDTIRIAATPGIATVYMGPALKLLRSAYPDVVVTVSVDTTPGVLAKMRARQLDIGIGFFPSMAEGVTIEPLPEVEAVCVLPCDHPLGRGDEVHVKDLEGVPLICQEKETQTQYKVLSAFRAANIEPLIHIETNLAPLIYRLVESGNGVSIIEPISARDMVNRDVVIKPFRPSIRFEPGLAFPSERQPTALTRAFAEHVQALFQADFGD